MIASLIVGYIDDSWSLCVDFLQVELPERLVVFFLLLIMLISSPQAIIGYSLITSIFIECCIPMFQSNSMHFFTRQEVGTLTSDTPSLKKSNICAYYYRMFIYFSKYPHYTFFQVPNKDSSPKLPPTTDRLSPKCPHL